MICFIPFTVKSVKFSIFFFVNSKLRKFFPPKVSKRTVMEVKTSHRKLTVRQVCDMEMEGKRTVIICLFAFCVCLYVCFLFVSVIVCFDVQPNPIHYLY